MTHPIGDRYESAPAPPRVVRVTEDIAAPTPPVAGNAWRAPALAPDGTHGFVGGEYVLVDPPRRLETTWRTSWTGRARERVRFELAPIEVGVQAGTRITVTHTRADLRVHTTVSTVPRASSGVDDVVAIHQGESA